jgi:hypothetical protein
MRRINSGVLKDSSGGAFSGATHHLIFREKTNDQYLMFDGLALMMIWK